VSNLVRLQDKLLSKAAEFVRPGGTLMYCTCSLMPKEGQPRIDTFLQSMTDFRLIPILEASGLAEFCDVSKWEAPYEHEHNY